MERGLAHRFEVEPLVGIEVEHQPVGLLDILDPRAPAVELDRSHLHAGQQAVGGVDVEVGLLVPVLLHDADVLDRVAEAAGVVLLEEAFLGAALRTADQADRPAADPWQHDRRRRRRNSRRAGPW